MSARFLLSTVAAVALLPAAFAQTDDCFAPTVLTGTGTFSFDLTGFVAGSGLSSSCASIEDDGFFVWAAPATGAYAFETCGTTFDTKLAVYSGVDCAATCLLQNDDFCGLQSRIVLGALNAGDSILIQVGSFSNGAGGPGVLSIQPTVAPPANNTCATPTAVSGPGTYTWDNTLATTSGFSEGACMAGILTAAELDVFFAWTANSGGDYQFSTCGTGASTVINVYQGADCSAVCVGDSNNNDTCGQDDSYDLTGASSGDVYLIQLGMWFTSDAPTSSGVLNVGPILPPPANDTCAAPSAISGLGTHAFDTTTASESGFDGGAAPCAGTAFHRDVFFAWTATGSGMRQFDTIGTAFNTRLAVHSGLDCSATCVDWDDDSGGANASLVVLPAVTAGDGYLVQVGGWSSSEGGPGTLNVSIPPPPPVNDSCATASPITGVGAFPYDNATATTSAFDGGDAAMCSSAIVKDVFFLWTAPADGDYTFDTCGSSYDTRIAVHAGSGCAATCLLANDDLCSEQSLVTLNGLLLGDQILVQLGSFGFASGPADLNVSVAIPPPANDTCATPQVVPTLGTTPWNNLLATTSGFDGGNGSVCMSPLNSDTSSLGKAHRDLFFTYTVECDGDYNFTTEGSPFVTDTRLSVHLGTDCGATCMASNDDIGGGSTLSEVSLAGVTQGTGLLIQVGTWVSATPAGDGVLTIERQQGPCDCSCACSCPGGTLLIACDPANPHYQGSYAKLDLSSFGGASSSGLHIEATDGPSGEFGFFLISADGSATISAFNGILCLGPPSARYTSQVATNQGLPQLNSIGQFDATGVLQNLVGTAPSTGGSGFDVPVELPFTPAGQTVQPGDIWHFQLWYRDQVPPLPNPGSSANFSNMLVVSFP